MPLWLLGAFMVGGPIILSLFGLWLVRRLVSPQSLHDHHDVAGFILAIVGVIYAVLLAFVVVIVWEQFEDAKVVAEKEANALLDIYHMAPGLSPEVREQVRREVRAYAQSVVEFEWSAMANGAEDDNTARALDQLWGAFTKANPHTNRESALYEQSISRLTDVSDNRRLRLLAARNGLPAPLWIALIFGGVATIIFTYFFGIEKFANQARMTVLLSATIGVVLFIVSALDYPFTGDLKGAA